VLGSAQVDLPTGFKTDLRQETLIKLTFKDCAIQPNELQFAISQFAIAHSSKHRRQLWNVPAGQGKSRIMHSMALIALTMKNASKVHFLFENSHLMNRDQRDFDRYWKYNKTIFEGRVFYHH
jgi:hypothetical protein